MEMRRQPRRPSRSMSLDTFAKRPEIEKVGPVKGLQPKGSSSDDSLFGNFVKDRQDVVDFDVEIKVPLKAAPPRPRIQKSLSASRLTNLRQQQQRRQSSRNDSKSPDSARPSSMRSIKSRSRSPAVRKEDLDQKSQKIGSPKATVSKHSGSSPNRIKSPKEKVRKSHQGKSPKIPKKPSSKPTSEGVGGLSASPGREASSPQSTKEKLVVPAAADDFDDIPPLVDDSIVREPLGGERGGKQWNIMEDTPGGHAEEKMVMVPAIENDEQSSDLRLDDSDLLEEDDDIIDDPDEHSLVVARSRRRNSLPLDPSSAEGSEQQSDTAGDRFAPAFNNNDMWKGGGQLDRQLPPVQRSVSADVSLLSDHDAEDLESDEGELGNSDLFMNDQDEHALTPEEGIDEDDDEVEELNDAKTPATTKRSGGRKMKAIEAVPNLDADSVAKDGENEGDSHPSSVPEDESIPLETGSRRKSSRRKKRDPPSSRPSTGRDDKKGSNSTGRSSHRQSASRPRKERDALHSRRHKKIPDMVPTSMGSDGIVRSPMSSSLTSTPNSTSIMSGRSYQQNQSLQALRHHHSKNTPPSKRRPNKSLTHHVESHRDPSPPPDGDDYTLGASTITTNFSTTQRTRGDNTVSTRSLFQSERMGHHETPRLPQRRTEGSDDDDSGHGELKMAPQLPQRSVDNFSAAQAENLPLTAEELLAGKASPGKGEFRTVLRRPSGEGDDLLAMIESTHLGGSSEDLSLASSSDASSFQRWQKENGKDLISPQVHVRKHADGHGHTKAFLQLNPGEQGVIVEAEVADVADLKSPMTTAVATAPALDAAPSSSGSSVPPPTAPGIDSDSQHRPLPPTESVQEITVAIAVAPAPEVDLSGRIYGVGQVHKSPGDSPKKNKQRKSRLSLFKRVASWKGAVALADDDDEEEDAGEK